MSTDFKINGASELEKILKQLPKEVATKAVISSLRKGAKIIEAAAQSNVPVDNGNLRDAIVTRTVSGRLRGLFNQHQVVVTVKRPQGSHAHLVEFGTAPRKQKNGRYTGQAPAQPFMRPAVDSNAQAVIGVIGRELGKEIEKRAKKLAGSFKNSGLAKKRRGGKLRLK